MERHDNGTCMTSGEAKARETTMDGIERATDAFRGLFSGANTGKMLVKL